MTADTQKLMEENMEDTVNQGKMFPQILNSAERKEESKRAI